MIFILISESGTDCYPAVSSAKMLASSSKLPFIPLAIKGSTSTGSTVTGNSNSALDADVKAAGAAAAFRVVGFVSPPTDAFPDVLIKFNPGAHQMRNDKGAA